MVPKLPNSRELAPFLKMIDKNLFYTNFGPLNQLLENQLSNWFFRKTNEKYWVTSCSNATLGLQLTILALGLKPKSRILIPTFTFIASALAVINAGHIPVVADIDENSFLLTPEIASNALLNNTFDAVMPVTTFGRPCNLVEWENWKKKYNMPVLVDAAGAFGSQMPSETIPVVFSLHATKALPAGEGGIVVTRDESFSRALKKLSNFGLGIELEDNFSFSNAFFRGTNAKLSEYHAAVALASLDQFERWSQMRREKLHIFMSRIGRLSSEHFSFQSDMENIYAPTLFNLICANLKLRNQVVNIAAQHSIQTRFWYQPLLHQHLSLPKIQYLSETNNAEEIANKMVGLPFYPDIKKSAIDRIMKLLTIALDSKEICNLN